MATAARCIALPSCIRSVEPAMDAQGAQPQAVIVVVGPTASGKTALSLSLALALGGEVVSADAFAVYRGMDLGTAKPDAETLAAVPHHLVSVREPSERGDASRWLADAEAAIRAIAVRGRQPIVAGGTPLYVKALLEGLSAGPPRDEAVRARLRARLERDGAEALHRELARADPAYAAHHPASDERRLVRALEVLELTGQPYSSFHTTDGVRRADLRTLLIGLSWPREELHRRINRRVKEMFACGLIEEVARVRLGASPEAMQAVGYKEVAAHLDGEYDRERAIELVKRNTRRLARHQRTWYRRWRDIVWLEGVDAALAERALALARAFLAHEQPPAPGAA
jgi:tRNA dimethylallyltransferase